MNTNLVRILGFIAVAGAAACSSATDLVKAPAPEVPRFSCTANSTTMRLPADLRASLPTFGPREPDDSYVAISRSVPGGFAGMFLEDNHYVLTFVDPVAANRVRAQINQEFASRGFEAPPSGLDVTRAEFRAASWSFAELDEWYRYIIPRVGGVNSGISSTDIDEKANTIAFGVIDETARHLLESQLAALNVSCNLVTTVIQAYAMAA